MNEDLKIRERHLVGYRKEFGGYTGWHEWQVVGARGKILGRFDLKSQAGEFVAALQHASKGE